MKRGYVTVLSTEKYLEGLLVLNESLIKVESQYPLYAILTNDISKRIEERLNEKGIKTIRKEKFILPQDIINKNELNEKSRWSYTFEKLNVFELTEFEKIVFLDSDIYVRKNIDELFEKKNMSAVIDKQLGPHITARCLKLTSGVLVIEPKKGYIEKFNCIIKTIIDKRYAIGDQDILQEYDLDWGEKKELHLKNRYNTFFPYLEYYINFQEYDLKDFYVIHFIYPQKPWMIGKSENRISEYIKYVNDFTKKDYEKTGIPEFKDALYGDNSNARKIMEEYYDLLNQVI